MHDLAPPAVHGVSQQLELFIAQPTRPRAPRGPPPHTGYHRRALRQQPTHQHQANPVQAGDTNRLARRVEVPRLHMGQALALLDSTAHNPSLARLSGFSHTLPSHSTRPSCPCSCQLSICWSHRRNRKCSMSTAFHFSLCTSLLSRFVPPPPCPSGSR